MTTAVTSHELQDLDDTLSRSEIGVHDAHTSPDQTLPPVDGGVQAWRVLLAAFMFEAIFWGFPLSFGIFQEYYSSLPEFQGSPYITYIGSIATGIVYMGAPLMAPLVKRFPMYQRHMVVAGWVICLAGMVAGSFADTIGALIVTQGVMYGGKSDSLIFKKPEADLLLSWLPHHFLPCRQHGQRMVGCSQRPCMGHLTRLIRCFWSSIPIHHRSSTAQIWIQDHSTSHGGRDNHHDWSSTSLDERTTTGFSPQQSCKDRLELHEEAYLLAVYPVYHVTESGFLSTEPLFALSCCDCRYAIKVRRHADCAHECVFSVGTVLIWIPF